MRYLLIIALLFNLPAFSQVISDTVYFSDGQGGYTKVITYRNASTTSFIPKIDTAAIIATKWKLDSTAAALATFTQTRLNDTSAAIRATVNSKQATLVSATNIKTVNGNTLLGSGDVAISGTAAWGSVTGTLSNQTDLQNALNLKAPLASPTFTGTVSGVTSTMVGLGNVTNESKATMFTNAIFTGTFNVADGAIADADLANTVLPKLTTDANAVYGTTDAGNPGVISANNLIRQDAAYTLTSVATEQKLFNASTNGRLTLETGTYFFESVFSISALSATSGNAAFDILGAGGATLGTVLYHVTGVDGNTATAAAQTGSTIIQGQTPASMVTAGTGTTLNASLRGTFEITVAGTIVPSVTLVTAAAGSVAAGSYFRVRRIGSTTLTTVGQWD